MGRHAIYSPSMAKARADYSKAIHAAHKSFAKLQERSPQAKSLTTVDPETDLKPLKQLPQDMTEAEINARITRIKSKIMPRLSLQKNRRAKAEGLATLKERTDMDLSDNEWEAFVTMMDEIRSTYGIKNPDSDRVAEVAKKAIADGVSSKSGIKAYFAQWMTNHADEF